MKIKKMTAALGALDHAVLEPSDGLTVITVPNEADRSAWASFITAMLYGIGPWTRDNPRCLPRSGEMQVEWQGQDLTLCRFPSQASPFGGFQAVCTATGRPVPGLTAASAGKQLTGMDKEAYLRFAFVGQGCPIPHLSEKLPGLDGSIPETGRALRRKAEAEQELTRLQEKRQELQRDLQIWDRLERHDLNRRYAEAYVEWEKARAAEHQAAPEKAAQVRAAAEAARRRMEELAAQGGQLADTLEMLYPPAQSKAAVTAQLSAVERELARVQDELVQRPEEYDAPTVSDVPLVLDDALTSFDDERMALALELLREQSARRQILLFSCRTREADWARAHNVSVIKL